MSSESHASRSVKVLYRPVGRLCGFLSGVVAGRVFKRVWKRIAPGDHENAPTALQSEYGWGEILVAAMLQGAIAGGVRALINRGGARAFQRWTGEWPGD
jgi:NhaP-type Na+/H+ or K+/H+ antiporter